jgi:T5SS/PEP-CTERM-associated repeat protein
MSKSALPLAVVMGVAVFCCTPSLRAQTSNAWDFTYTGSIVNWTVPISGYYDVTAYGAQGGGFSAQTMNSPTIYVPGGRGAAVGGRFLLNQGEVLSILAGGTGGFFSGGGGGTFVAVSSTTPLVVAGGGGGTTEFGSYWPSASITTSGSDATYVSANKQGSGGTNGGGGTVGSESSAKGGAGGGGFFGDGQSHYGEAPSWATSNMYSAGGSSFINGGAGGSGGYYYVYQGGIQLDPFGGLIPGGSWTNVTVYGVNGGFGGGGEAQHGGGGGGGYSGGGGGAGGLLGQSGGGGGSFLATSASNAVMHVFHTGNGRVSISQAAVSLLVGESVTISTGSATYSNIVLGSTAGNSNESFSVVNAGTIVDSANYILVGQNGSNNAMTVSGGASVADQAFTVVGLNATASGNSLLVTGTGSTWSSGGLVIGDSGTGNSVSVEAGAGVASAGSGVALGYNVGSSGNSLVITGTGSTLTDTSDLVVGFAGSGNSVVVSNGGTLTNGQYTYGGVIGLNAGSTNNSVLVTGSGSTWNNSGALTIGSAGSGVLTIADGGSVSAAEVVIAAETSAVGTLNFGSYGGGDTAGNFLPSTISFGSGLGTVNFNQINTIAATGFSGTGSLNQRGTGTTVLTGSNSLAGTTTVSAGRLVVDGQPSLGASSIQLVGGTLALSGSFSDFSLGLAAGSMLITGTGSSWNRTSDLSVGNASEGASVVVSNGATVTGGAQVHLGPNTWATNNSILVTGSGSSWTNTATILVGATSSNNSLVVSDGGQVTAPLYVGRDAGSNNNSVLVTGSGSSLSTGLGNTTIIGYSGQGTLTVANGGIATAPQGALQIALVPGSSGILNIGGFGANDTAGTISAPGIAFGSGSGTINFNQTDTATLSAVISGTGSVNQFGSGTTILTGQNTFAGTTNVTAGTLLANSSSALGTSTVVVTDGGTLGGSGGIDGATTIGSGAALVPGAGGIGALSFMGGLTLAAGSTTSFQIHSTSDFTSISLTGQSVTYGGSLLFNLIDFSPVAGDQFRVFDMTGGASESGTFSSVVVESSSLLGTGNLWSGSNAGVTYEFDGVTGILSVQAVPEPATSALMAVAALAGVQLLRRQNRRHAA